MTSIEKKTHLSLTGFGQLNGNDPLPAKSEKGLKQILHQLHHLRRLWQACQTNRT
jgi:hypothetical protein